MNNYLLVVVIGGEMPELLIDLLSATAVIVLSLIWYFYLYPRMKKEYREKGWTWKRIYDIEVNNRNSYRELTGIIWTAIKGNRVYKGIVVKNLYLEEIIYEKDGIDIDWSNNSQYGH